MNVARRADDALDRADEHVREVDRVAEQVGRDAVAGLVDEEPPADRTPSGSPPYIEKKRPR